MKEYNFKGTNGDIKMFIGVNPLSLEDSNGSLVIPFYGGKFVMTYHIKRRGWEFPAGKRETKETILECAKRETYEEIGGILSDIIPLGYYTVDNEKGPFKTAIYIATVDKFEPKPRNSETDLVKLFDEIPKNVTYDDDVYKLVLENIKNKTV
ncbi:MAG: NUDIX domain-containing protein [Firmicutes bacterium]|nr:NUDIX domain-containing protein [Bacillota bacterium]